MTLPPMGDNVPEPVHPEDDPDFWIDQDRQIWHGPKEGPLVRDNIFVDCEFTEPNYAGPFSKNTQYVDGELREPGLLREEGHVDFDPSILASTLDFGAGMPTQKNRAEYLEHHGREDEAFERDE